MSDTTPIAPEPPKKRRKGCLIAGSVIGVLILGIAIWFGPTLMVAFRHGFFDKGPEKHAYSATSEENLKAMYTAMMLYHDSEGQFPQGDGWMDALKDRIRSNDLKKGEAEKKLIRPDLLDQPNKYGYALNDAASGKYIDDIKDPDKTPLVYESKQEQKNAHGDPKQDQSGIAISAKGQILK